MGPGGTVNYLFDGLSVIQETDGSNNIIKKYNPGISETDSNGTELFYSHDGLGSVVNLTDAKGNLVDKTEYEAFGQKGETKSGYYFTGATDGYTDADVQLVYMWNRWYDEGMGRFVSADPIGLSGGNNAFSYVGNNPLNMIDPWGLSKDKFKPSFQQVMINQIMRTGINSNPVKMLEDVYKTMVKYDLDAQITVAGGDGWGGALSLSYNPNHNRWQYDVGFGVGLGAGASGGIGKTWGNIGELGWIATLSGGDVIGGYVSGGQGLSGKEVSLGGLFGGGAGGSLTIINLRGDLNDLWNPISKLVKGKSK